METKYLTCAETAKMARGALKKNFAGVKFSVRSDNNSIRISWIDGPTTKAVDSVVKCFSSGRFDGMIDMAYNVNHWLLPDGTAIIARDPGSVGSGGVYEGTENAAPEGAQRVSMGARFVFTERKISPALRRQVVEAICKDFGISPLGFSIVESYDGGSYVQGPHDVPQLGTDMSTYTHRQLCDIAA